jgi:nicotinamide mononucleotide transporter
VSEWLGAHWLELFGFVTGAICVALAARRSIWNFPLGLLNSSVFFVVFTGAALYAAAGLQLVYIGLGVAGWVGWLRGTHLDDDRIAPRSTPRGAVLPLAAATVALTAGLWWVLDTWTDSTTQLADAATTGLSLTAQFMLNKRWLHNWLVWIIVDAGYVGLYLAKGLVPTALLYLIFIGIAVAGYRSWRATLTRENAMSDR